MTRMPNRDESQPRKKPWLSDDIPAARTAAAKAAERTTPPSWPRCIFEGEEKSEQRNEQLKKSRLHTSTMEDDVVVARYLPMTAGKRQMIEERSHRVETANELFRSILFPERSVEKCGEV